MNEERERRIGLFRSFLMNQLMSEDSTEEEIRNIMATVNVILSDDEAIQKMESLRVTNIIGRENLKHALPLIPSGWGPRIGVMFSEKRGVYEARCPKCTGQKFDMINKETTFSLGTCLHCQREWKAGWLDGIILLSEKGGKHEDTTNKKESL